MIEIDGEYWYSQLEAADFLSMTWRTVIHIKRNVKEIRTMKVANQNYYEFKSLAGYNQEHQRPSKRRDLKLWKHPELKNSELITDGELTLNYYSTKQARAVLNLDYGTYERFYTTMTNNKIGSFQSGRRIFWLRKDIDSLKERFDSSADISAQKLSELRQKVADLTRENERLNKENVILKYQLHISEEKKQEYEAKYTRNKNMEKEKNNTIANLETRILHMKELYDLLSRTVFVIAGFRLNNFEKNVFRQYLQGESYDKIAEKWHSDVDTVRNCSYRTLEKVENLLERFNESKDLLPEIQSSITKTNEINRHISKRNKKQ